MGSVDLRGGCTARELTSLDLSNHIPKGVAIKDEAEPIVNAEYDFALTIGAQAESDLQLSCLA